MRIPISRRGPIACFIAPCSIGANRKPIPTSSIHCPICSGEISIFIPNAINTFALPLCRVTPLLPCLATGTSAPATTNAEVVEMLKECNPVPPVLQVSTTNDCFVGTCVDLSRITRTPPIISSIVSPLRRNAVRKQAICASVVSPSIISFMVSTISASVKGFPSITF